MTVVFADTFYFLALLNVRDQAHEHAKFYSTQVKPAIVTTAWVLTELGDAMSQVPHRAKFLRVLNTLNNDPLTRIVAADQPLFDEGTALFAARPDKDWSLTDCISFVVMEREGISDALTGDHHFEQAGFVAILK